MSESSLRKLLWFGPSTDLATIDTSGTPGLPKAAGKLPKRWARTHLAEIGADLAKHQEQLYASAKSGDSAKRILLVLQAMDCGGKDGTTRRVAGTMNPQGLRIVPFGKPTEEELSHDFLWRIRRALPEPGFVGVFNRSHYEDVLVVRVHGQVSEGTWLDRYKVINAFEKELTGGGLTIVKVMLHISFEEQRRRLEQRLADPTKYWKYNPADIEERELWPAYQKAYQDALTATSTAGAPWYVVPGDRKWYRDWAVAGILRETMADMGLGYPLADFDIEHEKARLAEEPLRIKSGPDSDFRP
jgi:PPK2 family polyphosphate:nucleotide phosphotransferase